MPSSAWLIPMTTIITPANTANPLAQGFGDGRVDGVVVPAVAVPGVVGPGVVAPGVVVLIRHSLRDGCGPVVVTHGRRPPLDAPHPRQVNAPRPSADLPGR